MSATYQGRKKTKFKLLLFTLNKIQDQLCLMTRVMQVVSTKLLARLFVLSITEHTAQYRWDTPHIYTCTCFHQHYHHTESVPSKCNSVNSHRGTKLPTRPAGTCLVWSARLTNTSPQGFSLPTLPLPQRGTW